MFHKPVATVVGDAVLGTRPNFKKRAVVEDEYLHIDGIVRGGLDYPDHVVTVGASGRIKGNVRARSVVVEGVVDGEIHAGEYVRLRRTAQVLGDISAPRVSIDDGAALEGRLKTS